jgi:cyclopentanol dehydrogenase
MRLKDKTALVTGGSQGIGREIGETFLREGAIVYFCDVKEPSETLPEGGIFIKLDVTREEDWIQAVSQIDKAQGGLDILVNNAGINIRQTIEDMKPEELDLMMAINVKGPFLGIKHVIPSLRKRGGGSIINMSSICGLVGHKYTTEAYTTTKGALTLLTKSVAARYGGENIRVNSLHPSTVDTPLVQELFKNPDRKAERLGEVPLGRLATKTDVANAALYLASSEGAFLNGVSLPVDGD